MREITPPYFPLWRWISYMCKSEEACAVIYSKIKRPKFSHVQQCPLTTKVKY